MTTTNDTERGGFFGRLSHVVTRFAWPVIVVWIAAMAGLAALAGPRLWHVTSSSTSDFLPKKYESVRAVKFGEAHFGDTTNASTVTGLAQRSDGRPLTAADRARVERLLGRGVTWRPNWDAIKRDHPHTDIKHLTASERAVRAFDPREGPVAGGRDQLVSLKFRGDKVDPTVQKAFKQFRSETRASFANAGYSLGLTGGIAKLTDDTDAQAKTSKTQQMLLFAAIALLSLVFFRGILSSIVPLLVIMIVAGGASGLAVLSADAFGYKLDPSTPSLITTVLIGIGIDYFLFMTFRFREQLRNGLGRKAAATAAATKVSHVVASAALAIVVAFAALGLADFGQFRVLGPSVAIAILVMLLAGVTLVPAVLAASGRMLFWPSRSWRREVENGPAERIGVFVARRPGRVVLATAGLLGVLALVAVGTKLNYDLGGGGGAKTESARVDKQISAVLPKGVTDQQSIYVSSTKPIDAAGLESLRRRLATVRHVARVSAPVVVDGGRSAEIDLALDIDSTTATAIRLAGPGGELRETAHAAAPAGSVVIVGGNASAYADVSHSITDDFRRIFPIAAALILLILILMLRSVAAPVLLLLAVGLEFAGTLGAAVLVFQHGAGQTGVAFTLPLVLFLFVVAIGTDYNMLVSARLREELGNGASPRQAAAQAVRRVAPAITAAGLVLATSFASLMIYNDQGTKQMGFGMAVGILFASFVVSTLLVPALTALLGRKAWWPTHVGHDDETKTTRPVAALPARAK